MNNKINIFLVDDHRVVREGIKSIIEENPLFTVLGEASNGKEALYLINNKTQKPDVVLMDISMPIMDGIATTENLHKNYQGAIKVLALTMVKQGSYIKQMLKAGASGYILKNCDKYELFQAIQTVSQGQNHFSKAVSAEVLTEMVKMHKEEKGQLIQITNREKDVLNLIIKDLTNIEIADQLNISIRTVETHKQNLISKTHTKNIAGLVVYAIKNHLVEI